MKKEGKVIIITGPTGSGKTTIANYLLKNRPNTIKVVTNTTRSPRPEEVNGKDYNFVTHKEMQELIANGLMLEHAQVYNNIYGTSKAALDPIKKGFDLLIVTDVQGASTLKKLGIKGTYLFLVPNNESLLAERLKTRGDKDIKQRLAHYKEELKFKEKCDHIIDTTGSTSKDIENCGERVMKILNNNH